MSTTTIKDSVRKSFDIQEAAIMFDEYLKSIKIGRRISEIAKVMSKKLHSLVMARGMVIPPSYRSPARIQGRLRSLEGLYEIRDNATTPETEVFRQIIKLRNSHRNKYEELLKESFAIIDNGLEDKYIINQ